MVPMLLTLLMTGSVRLPPSHDASADRRSLGGGGPADLYAALAAQPPRQIDALLLDNPFLRVHLVTLNDVNHYRSTTDGAQVLYCLGSFVVLRDDGSLERCARGRALFVASGTIDFRADGDPRPDMLIAEIKQPPAGGFAPAPDDATLAAPDIYKVLLDNAAVRVMTVDIKPGQRTKMHRHPGYDFRYPLTTARTRSTAPDGRSVDVDMVARVPRWTVEESQHILENVGSTESVTILVELK
jgi:hypothetical protein